jgi:TolA-binding protein
MKIQLKTLATLALVSALSAGLAQTTASGTTSTTSPTPHKRTTRKPPVPKKPSVESQIQSLRDDMNSQIQQLKQQLSDRDQQLQQAQQAAAAAQAAATQAQQEASQQSATLTENTQAVSNLQGAVTDLKTNSTSLASTIQDQQAKVEKQIEHPDAIRFKGVTLSPTGSYLAGETVYRTHATASDIPTPFSSLPYEHADAYALSEFYGTARQSRVALMAEGKAAGATLRGYYEADWLGTGVTSNNNESNSYVFRERVLWAQMALNNGWAFTGGQLWSLATEDKKGLSNLSGDILTPLTIDPNYVPGFVWERQYGFRVTKTMQHAAFGIAAENPQLLYSATLAGNTPYAVLGSAGANGGNYNAAISTCSPSTSIVNYTNEVNGGINTYLPVYKTVNACTNINNYSFNVMPDIIVKAAFDPSFGHYEIFGIGRYAHETVYPGETTNSQLYGGLKDIVTGATVAPALSTAGSYNNNIALGGLGASGRATLAGKFTVGLKGLYGPGVGRYGSTTLSDVTSASSGEFSPLHNLSALGTVEIAATPRLVVYLNYGGDYAGRDSWSGTTLGAPTATQNATTKVWGGHWGTPAAAPVGYGSYRLSNSSCLTNAAPGYNGSSTGFYPGGSCGAQTKDVQEATAGYWYDFYKGDYGRVRLGMQYAYAFRQSWTGAPVSGSGFPGGVSAKGIDNMFWTSFRYYLP